jgi:hypothetical protein
LNGFPDFLCRIFHMILREVTSNQRGLKIQPSDLQKSHRHEEEYDC